MNPETRLLLINYYQGIADSLRAGTIQFTEQQARYILQGIVPTIGTQDQQGICNISQACRYLGISQPTFRKLIAQGVLPQGEKLSGFREKIWYKRDIEEYSRRRQERKKE